MWQDQRGIQFRPPGPARLMMQLLSCLTHCICCVVQSGPVWLVMQLLYCLTHCICCIVRSGPVWLVRKLLPQSVLAHCIGHVICSRPIRLLRQFCPICHAVLVMWLGPICIIRQPPCHVACYFCCAMWSGGVLLSGVFGRLILTYHSLNRRYVKHSWSIFSLPFLVLCWILLMTHVSVLQLVRCTRCFFYYRGFSKYFDIKTCRRFWND